MKQEADFERFNLRHLRYFLAVCDSGSFRAASAKLNIAQSAVSRRIADLERIFDVKLLKRLPRGVALTSAGAVLRDSALSIGREIDSAYATLERYERGEAGALAAGFFGTTARLGFVPDLIARFRAAHPHIRLEIHPLPHGVPDEAALATLDIAFLESRPDNEERMAHRLHGGMYMLALPRNHALAALANIPFTRLCREEVIGMPQATSPFVYDRLIREAARRGQALNIIHEAESECSRLAFAAAGMGVAIVSPLAINHDQHFEVEYRPIADMALPFELWLSVRRHGSAATDQFAEIARTLLAELPSLSA